LEENGKGFWLSELGGESDFGRLVTGFSGVLFGQIEQSGSGGKRFRGTV
jgi:hypothetical protein